MSHRDDYLRGLQDARRVVVSAEGNTDYAATLIYKMILAETQRLQGHKKEMKRALDALRPKWPASPVC
jgi:hypothetical protein